VGRIVAVILNGAFTRLTGLGLASVIALSFGTATGVSILTATGAEAQAFFSFFDPPAPRKKRRAVRPYRPSIRPNAAVKIHVPDEDVRGPLVLNVAINKQRVTVYDSNGVVSVAPISTGMPGHPTPTGIFTILEKNRTHYSNLYAGAPMPNMQRITWSGIAMHAGALPGYPASHGCIRLPYGYSKRLFGLTKLGARVIVTRDPVAPVSFTHEKLFAAYPSAATMTRADLARQETQVADATGTIVGSTGAGLPRSPYSLKREARAGRLTAAIREAGYFKLERNVALAQAGAATKQAKRDLKAARAEAGRLKKAARVARKKKASAEKAFAAFAWRLKRVKSMTEAELQAAAAKEDRLEEAAFELGDAAEAAKEDAKAAALAIESYKTAVKKADAKRKDALRAYTEAKAQLKASLLEEKAAKRREAKRHLPVSVFVSRKTQRLYVRQGHTPVLDLPVTIENPERLIGTHVFTALDYVTGKQEMTWNVVSIPTVHRAPTKRWRTRHGRKVRAKPIVPAPQLASRQTAPEALERLSIPADAREFIDDVMKPGSSFVISDQGIGRETGKHTDFIVSLR
jgi:lipoprotein-anchoring transpeptidase ErfK/SrfK